MALPPAGCVVEINGGKHKGSRGCVVQVSNQDSKRPYWQVKLSDGAQVWVDTVRPIEVGTQADTKELVAGNADVATCHRQSTGSVGTPPTPQEFPIEGDAVEITAGSKVNFRGRVAKVVGDNVNERRWQIKLENGALTWVTRVRPLSEEEAAMGTEEWKSLVALKASESASFASKRPADIAALPWEKATFLKYVGGGSGGVMLAAFGKECAVFKSPGQRIQQEIIAENLAVACGVKVARSRIVKCGEDDHASALEHLSRCDVVNDESCATKWNFLGIYVREDRTWHLRRGVGTELLYIVEFVPGHTLVGIDARIALARSGCKLLSQIGRLCALDVLLNNFDRFPLPIWQNDGNPGNVMITGDGSEITGIDQQVFIISEGPARDSYLEKVKTLVADVAFGKTSQQVVHCIRKALASYCATDVEDAEADSFLDGFRGGLQAISDAWNDGRITDSLEKTKHFCKDRLKEDLSKHQRWRWIYTKAQGLNEIESFVSAVAECLADGVALWSQM